MVSFGHGPIWASTKNVQQKTEAHSDTPKPVQPAHLTSLLLTDDQADLKHPARRNSIKAHILGLLKLRPEGGPDLGHTRTESL